MRTFTSLFASLFVMASLSAQQDDRSYFGIKAGANFSTIQLDPDDSDGDYYNTSTGFAGGAFYHIAFSNSFALQPELLFSEMGAEFDGSDIGGSVGQVHLNYLSMPILFKISPIKSLGILLGPQMDMFSNGKIKYDESTQSNETINNSNTGSDLNFALTGGVQFRLGKSLNIYGRYIYGLSDVADGAIGDALGVDDALVDVSNSAFQVGLSIGLPYKAAPAAEEEKVMAPPPDADADGTPDMNDHCPTVAGTAKYNGCPTPDTDSDGINDEVDKCPAIFGTSKYGGCPVPDTDGDGFNDEQDKCPNQAGTLAFNGCPVPDSDGDGIKDDMDACPNQRGSDKYKGCPVPDSDGDGVNDDMDSCDHYPGDASNHGCPVMTIYFENGDPKLSAIEKARLDEALVIINNNPEMKLSIEGHASSVGNAEYNKKLSQQRADNVMAYFASKGVAADRMTAVGKGEETPVTSDNKKDGETLSRRVVLKTVQ